MRCLPTTICLGLCFCVTPLMFAPFNPFRCFVPNQFEPAATVAINRHSKQALAYETNQSAGKIDRQQDAEDLQNGKRLLIEGSPKDCALWVMAVHGTMISSLPPACRQAGTCRGSGANFTRSRSRTVCARMRASARCRRTEATDDARAAADHPVKPFDHVVRADPPAVLGGELGQEVGRASSTPRAGTWRPPRASAPPSPWRPARPWR